MSRIPPLANYFWVSFTVSSVQLFKCQFYQATLMVIQVRCKGRLQFLWRLTHHTTLDIRKPIRSDRRDRTIRLCTCKSLFNSRPFLFLFSNHVMMSLCTHFAARQWPRLKFSLSFRKQLWPYDLTISLRAEEFKPYEPRPFVVVSKLKATGLPLCFIVSLFSRFVTLL